MARLGIRTTAAAMGAAVLLVTGCSSGDGGDDLITIDPATAAVSPATTSTPDGVVHPYSGLIDSITFDPITRSAVLVANDPRSVLVVPSDSLAGADPASAGRPIALDSDVRDVSIGSDGSALLAMDRQVVKLNLTSGEQTSI
ncbi:MAG: hypothetical protein EOP29_28225, partial [Rhodococcus sp. (in: high G+C Gram-positive bacteria)]